MMMSLIFNWKTPADQRLRKIRAALMESRRKLYWKIIFNTKKYDLGNVGDIK